MTIPIVSIPTNLHFEKFQLQSVLQQKKMFFAFCSVRLQKKVTPCCEVNFDATDLPHSFEPLYPKVFRGSLQVDLVPIVCHTAPPKVRKAILFTPKQAVFLHGQMVHYCF